MSTKKEKCCGCPEEQDICRGECMCHHSQSESIELEDFLDDEGMLCESYDESGRQEQDGITEKQLEKLKEFFSQAITTAVAKRERDIAWKISKYTPGFMVKSGKIDESDAPGYEKGRRFLSSLIFH